jgi:predicted transcriptional regulator
MLGVTKAAVCHYEKDCLKPSNQIMAKINEVLKPE